MAVPRGCSGKESHPDGALKRITTVTLSARTESLQPQYLRRRIDHVIAWTEPIDRKRIEPEPIAREANRARGRPRRVPVDQRIADEQRLGRRDADGGGE